jgi:hypothetical protein
MNYKTSLVNFEVFFVPKEQRVSVIMEDIARAAAQGCDTILGLMLADGFLFFDNDTAKLLITIEEEGRKLGIKNFILMPGIVPNMDIPGYEVIKTFNFNLHLSYLSYKDKRHLLHPWNRDADKFLFLGGVPDRPNRINLLEKFYKSGLLEKAVWSFFKPWTNKQSDWCREALSNYSDEDYSTFLNACENSIDDMYTNSKEYGTHADFNFSGSDWFKDPAWIDPQVYANTVLSIVSEGQSADRSRSYFLTEKTWRVFAQRHPFMLAADDTMLDYVKSLGFKTFNKSCDLDDVVSATHQFLELREDVTDYVEHNHNLFFELGASNVAVLDDIQTRFSIKQVDMDAWFNKTGFAHLIRNNNV